MTVIAQSERLRLRTWKHGDQAKVDRYCNTVRVMDHLGGVQPKRLLRDDVRWFKRCWNENGHTLWVLESSEDDEFLGFCGLDLLMHDVPRNLLGEVEIGWRLREDAWGHGYATEAATVVLDLAFRVHRMDRVVSRTDVANEASIRVMRKLGMRRWPEREQEPNEVVYRIRRDDWLKGNSSSAIPTEMANE